MLSRITPLILTFNEQHNIGRALLPLDWAKQIVVLDSGSSDDTVAIASKFANVVMHTRPFDDHTRQWNHGLSLVNTEWVLTLDADYITDAKFANELRSLEVAPNTNAFFAEFVYCIFDRPLRASLYPPRAVLFRRDAARYVQDGHTQLLQFEGNAGNLRTPILHDDRKPLSHWINSQDRYAQIEAKHLLGASLEQLKPIDKLRRKLIIAPLAVFIYTLLGKGLILDGWAGWYYVLQRTVAELMLSLRLIEQRLAR